MNFCNKFPYLGRLCLFQNIFYSILPKNFDSIYKQINQNIRGCCVIEQLNSNNINKL